MKVGENVRAGGRVRAIERGGGDGGRGLGERVGERGREEEGQHLAEQASVANERNLNIHMSIHMSIVLGLRIWIMQYV